MIPQELKKQNFLPYVYHHEQQNIKAHNKSSEQIQQTKQENKSKEIQVREQSKPTTQRVSF